MGQAGNVWNQRGGVSVETRERESLCTLTDTDKTGESAAGKSARMVRKRRII